MPVSPRVAKGLDIVGTVDRVASAISAAIQRRVVDLADGDHDVDPPREWYVHKGITWETGWNAKVDTPGIFVHTSHRALRSDDDGRLYPSGPDLNVGFYFRCHPDNIIAAARLGSYVVEALWTIATENGYAPHLHNHSTFGRPESSDWGVAGTVLFGLIDGAPEAKRDF